MSKIAGYIWAFAIIVGLVGVGYLLRFATEKAPQGEVIVKTDTLIVRDTITETEPVYVTKIKTEYDTVVLDRIVRLTDTVKAVIPIDYDHAHYEDADVWYHGYDAAIDSVQVYPETRYITIEKTVKEAASRWGIGIDAGYGVGKGGLTPYVGVGLHYDLIRFPKRKRNAKIDYD